MLVGGVVLVGCGPSASSPTTTTSFADRQASAPDGTWYLDASGNRLTLTIAGTSGQLRDEQSGDLSVVDAVGDERSLSVHRRLGSADEWYRLSLVEGVASGRFAVVASGATPSAADFVQHVTGWRKESFETDLVPRAFDLLLAPLDQNDDEPTLRARLRLDRGGDGTFVGQLKVYASVESGAADEAPAVDLSSVAWDGSSLSFGRPVDDGSVERWQLAVVGRTLAGRRVASDGNAAPVSGERAEILSHGLAARPDSQRSDWATRTRAQLLHLIMADAPAPLTTTVTTLTSDAMPATVDDDELPDQRDDDPDAYAPSYLTSELRLDVTLPNPTGGAPLARTIHARLAVPTGTPPASGFPAVVAVNGHSGSARRMLDPSDEYFWYGDSYARHGWVVLALDISHRPLADRSALYTDYATGDDPDGGNGLHPAIAADGFDSDWEEDGERVWDAMQARAWLATQPNVDGTRVIVSGLSMGGEVATLAGALDPGFAATVAAGYSPELGVVRYHGNHPCWQWQHADVREYVDTSDYHALVAPRPLIVETGSADATYSDLWAPFAADKEVLRRSRVAWADASRVIHYLHSDVHHFHVGGGDVAGDGPVGVCTPQQIAPSGPGDDGWQTDPSVSCAAGTTLYDLLGSLLP